MINLDEFIQELALGELNGTNLVELSGFSINAEKLPRVIQSLNQALEKLYTLFPIKVKEVVIQLHPNISRYYLDSEYAASRHNQNNTTPVYLLDSIYEPFEDDLNHIELVKDEEGNLLSVNDNMSLIGVDTPEYNCISLKPKTMQYTKHLVVQYSAGPKRIPLDVTDTYKLKIDIPPYLKAPLTTLVASMYYQNCGGSENISASNNLFAKFRTLIEEINQKGIGYTSQTGTNLKPKINGWI